MGLLLCDLGRFGLAVRFDEDAEDMTILVLNGLIQDRFSWYLYCIFFLAYHVSLPRKPGTLDFAFFSNQEAKFTIAEPSRIRSHLLGALISLLGDLIFVLGYLLFLLGFRILVVTVAVINVIKFRHG